MSGSERDENVQKLAAIFGNGDPVAAGVSPQKGVPIAQIKTGVLSPRQEDEGHYYAIAVMKKGKDRLKPGHNCVAERTVAIVGGQGGNASAGDNGGSERELHASCDIKSVG